MTHGKFPVDIDYLHRFTGGDRKIDQEILSLFHDQCRECLHLLDGLAKSGEDDPSWREVAHRLKGAALGIGAFDLGHAAAAAEALTPARARTQLERLKH